MEIIKRSDIVASAPKRWAKQYSDGCFHEITKALRALKPGFTAEEVNEIIGNDSWTVLCCDECTQDSPVLVSLSMGMEYRNALCIDCLKKAVAMVEAANG